MAPSDHSPSPVFAEHGLDAVIAYTRASLRHLGGVDFPVAGWGAEERTWLVWTPERRILLTPEWGDPYAREFAHDGVEVRFFYHPEWPVDALVGLLRELDLGEATIGIEKEQVPMAVADTLREELPGIRLRGIDDTLSNSRATKTPDEVEKMRLAARAAELGMIDAIAASSVGTTEREFAHLLQKNVIAHGAETISWLAIRWGDDAMRMAFRDVPIKPGELINIEMGCTVDGYFADVQRMVAATPVSEEIADAYRLLHATNRRTMLGIRPGMSALGVYEMYLEDMRQAGLEGWSSYFLGHGIGLGAHEGDLLWAESDASSIIPDDSFFALEPATTKPVLLSIEDTVHVSSAGNDIISAHGDWSELVVLGQQVRI